MIPRVQFSKNGILVFVAHVFGFKILHSSFMNGTKMRTLCKSPIL